MEEARDAFGSRLINLAKAHDVLTRESWASANLAEIIADTVKPHAGGENRFHIEGPDLQLAPSAALGFAMALHELCTNAAKYGALSTENGHVSIVWAMEGEGDERRLILHWAENGGPKVVPPKHKGFGSRLIERALAADPPVSSARSMHPCRSAEWLKDLGGQPDSNPDSDRRR
ncbi:MULTISPECIES: sensor histidine kinase [Rhizobium]|uniref:histidine kinase n=1 Tax=Rhizobium favelukesii TaxID=348824 RepID=W6RSB4_9HYPH|nr:MULTISPECIES: sensor histidine kinase [Rhizobium]MCA0804633.1 sensor histidine kinase [Rhizobium sp. T1473]MCS0462111.1 sensor histidine kinase [Rhizobium favelukesii]UFS79984.1 sensor histidine kinase [Rhizobium sp. T136]CDM61708.1 hypothetical protein LPU83_pLPU83d_0337 [Rhizobium favelukesii]